MSLHVYYIASDFKIISVNRVIASFKKALSFSDKSAYFRCLPKVCRWVELLEYCVVYKILPHVAPYDSAFVNTRL